MNADARHGDGTGPLARADSTVSEAVGSRRILHRKTANRTARATHRIRPNKQAAGVMNCPLRQAETPGTARMDSLAHQSGCICAPRFWPVAVLYTIKIPRSGATGHPSTG
ncbi:hypothetical protein Sgleb_64020 [Streptomyces glebosus]|uniref:Uncharacterized protein n=1 Tax=Streptomyces glebosus TaxID=249580 RepID=A0A640T9L2_9ACTN|nr:hypothetical protein Sgleb_64020 [Streptomyces glebosus]GHG58264.1 hypothetical protein GCM10010513_22250 [Streptomyces glebosus]